MEMVCPTCAGGVSELIWIYFQKYYCSETCVPLRRSYPVGEARRGDYN